MTGGDLVATILSLIILGAIAAIVLIWVALIVATGIRWWQRR